MKRVEWLDICKGLGMILVVLGHTLTTPVRQASGVAMGMYNAIYFFHMPLMIYLSGRAYGMAVSRYKTRDNVVGSKIKSLIIPYVIYNVFVYLVFCMANMIGSLSGVLSSSGYGRMSLTKFVNGMIIGDNKYSFHMWYIYALFIMFIITYLVDRYIDKKMVKIVVIIISVILAASRYYLNTAGLGVINVFMQFYMYFLLGQYMDFSLYVKKIPVIIFEIVSVPAAYIFVFKGNLVYDVLGYRAGSVIAWIPVVGLIFICVTISTYLNIFKDIFLYLGKNSFIIYMFHQPFFGSGVGLVLMKVIHLPWVVAVIISFILCFSVPLIIEEGYKRLSGGRK